MWKQQFIQLMKEMIDAFQDLYAQTIQHERVQNAYSISSMDYTLILRCSAGIQVFNRAIKLAEDASSLEQLKDNLAMEFGGNAAGQYLTEPAEVAAQQYANQAFHRAIRTAQSLKSDS